MDKLYHIHPGLVKDGIASLSSTCHRNIKSSRPKLKIPEFAVSLAVLTLVD
jgi:hypothetical protein